MNKEQWKLVRDGVLEFNRLVTTPIERRTEEYILKCYDLLEEESREMYDAIPGTVAHVDGVMDSIVTSVQLIDAITPSQLEWDYVKNFIDYEVHDKNRDIWVDFLGYAIQTGEGLGYNVFGAMMEVNRSNLSKICPVAQLKETYGDNIEAAMRAASEWIEENRLDGEGNQRYYGVHGKIVFDTEGVHRVVFRDDKLKVQKPVFFSEPNLEPYLKA